MVLGSSRPHWLQSALFFAAIACLPLPLRAETVVAAVEPSAQPPAPQTADISTVDGSVSRTRFLIGLEESVQYQVFSLSNPNRVIVQLPEVKMQLPNAPGETAVGLVKSFSAGISAPGKARVVIFVTEPVVVESSKLEPAADGKSHNLALEIVPAEKAKAAKKPLSPAPYALGAAGLQPPLPLPAVRRDVLAARAFKPVIVIDPGHGGHDSGGMKNGTVEKDVVLAFSKVLRDKIEARGQYKVLLTRDTDVFVELDARREFAERNKAALFIAVHADYASTQARGATIYSLRENVATQLERSAKGAVSKNVLSATEIAVVKKASGDVDVVKGILADLAERDLDLTRERTNVFSRSVVEYMGSSTGMRNDPDQQAAFRVLKTAQFPSVLIELAYVTNKEDAELLKSDSWRGKVADSIVTAVENYFSHQIARLPM
jgi:N-acetylmuramoyl-L-alanine amidase